MQPIKPMTHTYIYAAMEVESEGMFVLASGCGNMKIKVMRSYNLDMSIIIGGAHMCFIIIHTTCTTYVISKVLGGMDGLIRKEEWFLESIAFTKLGYIRPLTVSLLYK